MAETSAVWLEAGARVRIVHPTCWAGEPGRVAWVLPSEGGPVVWVRRLNGTLLPFGEEDVEVVAEGHPLLEAEGTGGTR